MNWAYLCHNCENEVITPHGDPLPEGWIVTRIGAFCGECATKIEARATSGQPCTCDVEVGHICQICWYS